MDSDLTTLGTWKTAPHLHNVTTKTLKIEVFREGNQNLSTQLIDVNGVITADDSHISCVGDVSRTFEFLSLTFVLEQRPPTMISMASPSCFMRCKQCDVPFCHPRNGI